MTDDLVTWLRQQITQTRIAAERGYLIPPHAPVTGIHYATAPLRITPGFRDVIREQCDAYDAILDLHVHERPYPDIAPDEIGCRVCDVSTLDGGLDTAPNAWCRTVHAVAYAHRHRPGYRREWAL